MKKLILTLVTIFKIVTSATALSFSAQFNGFKQSCYYTIANEPYREDIAIVNTGDSTATSFTYTYQWDDERPVEREIVLSQASCHFPGTTAAKVGKGGQTSFFCDLGTAPATLGEHKLTLNMTKINGHKNEYSSPLQVQTIHVVNRPTLPQGYKTFTFVDSDGIKTARGYNRSKRSYNVGMVLDSLNTPELIGATIIGMRVTDVPMTGTKGFRAYMAGCKNVPTFSGFASIQDVTPENNTIECLFLNPESFPCTWESPVSGVKPKNYNKLGVGYTFYVDAPLNDSTRYPVMSTSRSTPNPNAFFLTGNDDQKQYAFSEAYWDNKSNDWGAAPITLYYLPAPTESNAIPISANPPQMVMVDQPSTVPVTVKNEAQFAVKSIQYTLDIDNQAEQATISGFKINANAQGTFNLPIKALPKGVHNVTLTLDSLNSLPNVNQNRSLNFKINVVDPYDGMPADTFRVTYYKPNGYNSFGADDVTHYDVCIKFNDAKFNGTLIEGVEMGILMSQQNKTVDSIKVWVQDRLTNSPIKDNVTIGLKSGRKVIGKFDKPIVYKAPMYIGYSLDVSPGNLAVPMDWNTKVEGQMCIVRMADRGNWTDYTPRYGATTVGPILSGQKENGLKVAGMVNDIAALAGTTFDAELMVDNYSGKPVTELTYEYSGEGIQGQKTISLEQPLSHNFGRKQKVMFKDLPVPIGSGQQPLNLRFTKVNGTDNIIDQNVTMNISIPLFLTTKRTLMEENTGTACGWCPRGVVGIHALMNKYPELITAAYHSYNADDPMYLIPMSELPFKTASAPASAFDRGDKMDPFYGTSDPQEPLGIELDYQSALRNPAPANLDIHTSWNDEKNEINVETQARFAYALPGKTYTLAYLVTMDGLSDESWQQSNFFTRYPEYKDTPYLEQIYDGSIDFNIFDHVVIELGSYRGVFESLPETIEIDSIYTHTTTLSLKDCKMMDNGDRENINVIAMLLDNDGKVCNARVVTAGESTMPDPVEIVNIKPVTTPDSQTVEYYDIMGRRVENPSHGIFIRRQGEKTTKVAL